jgi:integrase
MPADIKSVSARDRLRPHDEPYYAKLSSGCYLGFRKMTAASVGCWLARYRDDTGKQRKLSLGTFDTLPASQRFDAAKKAAEGWFAHMGAGGRSERIDVKTACEAYVEHVRHGRSDAAADDLEARFRRKVYSDKKLSHIELSKLTRPQVEAWRRKIGNEPVRVNYDDQNPRFRERSAASVNRDMTALRAALNHAHDSGYITSDEAWRVALRPIHNADRRRDGYLDRDQRRALLGAVPGDLQPFLRCLSQLPLRPGALAALTVANYEQRLGVLTVGKDKAGRDRRVLLPKNAAELMDSQIRNKLPGARIFTRQDGKPWTKDAWKKPVKAAATSAGLSNDVVLYSLRHSAITDLIVDQQLDLLTVAQISGTSVAMIERHYGHLRGEKARDALASLAL